MLVSLHETLAGSEGIEMKFNSIESSNEQINEPSNFSLVGELGTLVGLSEVSYSCSTCDFKVKTLEEMADHSMTFRHF